MPAQDFFIEEDARKQIKKLPRIIQIKLVSTFQRLKENPISEVKLKGELKHLFKYKVGDYRVIYSFDSKQSLVRVISIEHRQGVYK